MHSCHHGKPNNKGIHLQSLPHGWQVVPFGLQFFFLCVAQLRTIVLNNDALVQLGPVGRVQRTKGVNDDNAIPPLICVCKCTNSKKCWPKFQEVVYTTFQHNHVAAILSGLRLVKDAVCPDSLSMRIRVELIEVHVHHDLLSREVPNARRRRSDRR